MNLSNGSFPATSRVAIFHGPGQAMEIATRPVPALLPGELLVRVLGCTICGSDLHTWLGRRPVAGPTVLGHEILGQLVAVAEPHAAGLVLGDRVSWSLCNSCGSCYFCHAGIPQKCEQLRKYGHEADAAWALSGGLSDYCVLRPGTAVFRVPAALPDLVACPANCATATVAAALRAAGSFAGGTVLILGAGMLGLTAAAMARRRGAAAVILADVDADRAARGPQFGATRSVWLRQGPAELQPLVAQDSGGRGADVVLEVSGAPEAVAAAGGYCRTGGRLILVGSVYPTPPIALQPEQIVRRLLRIEGVHNYTPADLQTGLEFLAAAQDQFPFASLVERRFPLEQVDEAFRCAAATGAIRLAVVP